MSNRLAIIEEEPIVSEIEFDPEGSGYDYQSAEAAGLSPDEAGHWPSRDPKTGQILKGQKHETYYKTIKGEEVAGFKISKGRDGKYYSQESVNKLAFDDAEEMKRNRDYLTEFIISDRPVEEWELADQAEVAKQVYNSLDKPQDTWTKISNANLLSKMFDVDFNTVLAIQPEMTKEIFGDELYNISEQFKKEPIKGGYFLRAAEALKRGNAQWIASKDVYAAAFKGMGNEEEVLSRYKDVELKGLLNPISGGNWLSELSLRSLEIVPGMARGYWEAIPEAFTGMVTGMGVGFAGGQMGPQALLPEEAITVPLGAVTGLKIGFMSGSAIAWYEEGAGTMYASMRDKDYDKDFSRNIAGVAAIPYALVELSQVSKLTPGLRKQVLNVGIKSMHKVIKNAVKRWGTTWTEEVFEEVVQEIIQIGAEDTAGFLSDKLHLPEGMSKYLLERGLRLWDTLKGAGKAMALLPVPGAVIDISTGTKGVVSQKRRTKLNAKIYAERAKSFSPEEKQIVAAQAKKRLFEIEQKAEGRPANKNIGDVGQPRQILTPQEMETRDFLRENSENPDAVIGAFGLTKPESTPTQAKQTDISKGDRVGLEEKGLEAKQGVSEGRVEVFRGDSSKIDISNYNLNKSLDENIKQLGSIFSEGPGIYFTTKEDTAKGYGTNVSKATLPTGKFIDSKAKPLSRKKIKAIVKSFDKETLETAASNWDEDYNTGIDAVIDSIMESDTAHDQLIGVWAEILAHQNPDAFVQVMTDNGIDGVIVDKKTEKHFVVYNKKLLSQPPKQDGEGKVTEKTFIHETEASFDKFDLDKAGSGQGEAWLGKGIYLNEKGSFKIEQYGKNKIEANLSPDAKIFEVKNTPEGKYRDTFVEYAVQNGLDGGQAQQRIDEGLSLDNLLPRDILRNNYKAVQKLKEDGYDGLYQDGELVIYNPDVLKVSQPTKQGVEGKVVTGSAAIDEINRAFDAGEMDEGTHKLATHLIENIDSTFDKNTTIEIINATRKATKDIIKREGLPTKDPITGKEIEYGIYGETVSNLETLATETAVKLYRGHDADTLVEEWYHRGYDRLSKTEQKLFNDYHKKKKDPRSPNEHFAQEGRDYFFSSKFHEKASGIKRLFGKARDSLRALIDRIRELRGSRISKKILDLYEKTGKEPAFRVTGSIIPRKTKGEIKLARMQGIKKSRPKKTSAHKEADALKKVARKKIREHPLYQDYIREAESLGHIKTGVGLAGGKYYVGPELRGEVKAMDGDIRNHFVFDKSKAGSWDAGDNKFDSFDDFVEALTLEVRANKISGGLNEGAVKFASGDPSFQFLMDNLDRAEEGLNPMTWEQWQELNTPPMFNIRQTPESKKNIAQAQIDQEKMRKSLINDINRLVEDKGLSKKAFSNIKMEQVDQTNITTSREKVGLGGLVKIKDALEEVKTIEDEIKDLVVTPVKTDTPLHKAVKSQEAITAAEAGYVPTEPVGEAFIEHIDYFQNRQLPKGSKIPELKRAIKKVNGKRLSSQISPTEANKFIAALRKKILLQAEEEGIALQISKGGKVKVGIRESGIYVPDEVAKYTGFQDIQPMLGGGQDITRAIQQMDGSLSVRKKLQVSGQAGPLERHVLWPTREMSKQKLNWLKEKTIKIKTILDVKKGSNADTDISIILERIGSADRDTPIENLFSKEELELFSNSTIDSAKALRAFYDELIEEQNEARVIRGETPIPYRKNYSPHILADVTVWEQISMIGKEVKETLKDLPDYIKPNRQFNPRSEARKGNMPYEIRIKSARELAENYIITASKDIFNTAIIQNNKAFIDQIRAMGYEKSAEYLDEWTATAYAGIKPRLDRTIKLPNWAEKDLRYFNRLRNMAVFPLNVAWSLSTQPLSLANTIGRYGVPNTVRGFFQWLKPSIRKQAAEDYYSYIVKSSRQGRVTKQDASNLIGENISSKKSVAEFVEDYSTILLTEMEKLLTGTSIRAAHIHGAKRGLEGEALKQYASDGGGKTQSMYNDEDKPMLLRALLVKSGAPYQTYAFEVANTLREWAGKTGTPADTKLYAMWSITRWLAAMIVLRLLANKVRGKKWSWWDLIPIPFREFWLSPIVNKLTGEYLPGSSGLTSPVETGVNVAKGINDVLETGNWRKLRNEMLKYGPGVLNIPGGVQWSRMVDAMIAYSNGGLEDRRGHKMFKISTPKDLARAMFTGVWSTEGGQKRLDQKDKKKTTKIVR